MPAPGGWRGGIQIRGLLPPWTSTAGFVCIIQKLSTRRWHTCIADPHSCLGPDQVSLVWHVHVALLARVTLEKTGIVNGGGHFSEWRSFAYLACPF